MWMGIVLHGDAWHPYEFCFLNHQLVCREIEKPTIGPLMFMSVELPPGSLHQVSPRRAEHAGGATRIRSLAG